MGWSKAKSLTPLLRRREEMERGCQPRRGSTKLMVARAMVGWYTRRGCPQQCCHIFVAHPAVTLAAPRPHVSSALVWPVAASRVRKNKQIGLKMGLKRKGYYPSRSRSRLGVPAAGREWSTTGRGREP